MENKRKLKRRHLIYYLRVFDYDTKDLLGHLVDITTEGIMLISEKPIPQDKNYRLLMTLPREISGVTEVSFQAKSKWSQKDVNPDFYDTGFQLSDIDERHAHIIERLINDFLFQE